MALVVIDHVHHDAAERWLAAADADFTSCPIAQGPLIRLLIRQGQSAVAAQAIVDVIGHRQVTDAYLAQLARSHSGRLATFDHGLAELHSDVGELVPV